MIEPQRPLYSPDGRFLWDGFRWVPLAEGRAGTTEPRRSAVLHFFASFILIGLGTVFAGRLVKGFVLFVLGNGSLIAATILTMSLIQACSLTTGGASCPSGYPARGVVLAVGSLGLTGVLLWIYGLFDAVASTRDWNREHGWPR